MPTPVAGGAGTSTTLIASESAEIVVTPEPRSASAVDVHSRASAEHVQVGHKAAHAVSGEVRDSDQRGIAHGIDGNSVYG